MILTILDFNGGNVKQKTLNKSEVNNVENLIEGLGFQLDEIEYMVHYNEEIIYI